MYSTTLVLILAFGVFLVYCSAVNMSFLSGLMSYSIMNSDLRSSGEGGGEAKLVRLGVIIIIKARNKSLKM